MAAINAFKGWLDTDENDRYRHNDTRVLINLSLFENYSIYG